MLQDTFTIKELFSKDIERNINGVVQAGQIDELTKHDELSEYVMTQEIEENMAYFYQNYVKSLEQPTTAVGAWISGFFGSGKSHFLKILSYLLDGQTVYGKKPVDYFLDKTDNQTLLEQMKHVATYDTHSILFNIDSKASAHNRPGDEKEMIVEVFLKSFNEHLGYSSTLWIADMERQIAEASDYEVFKRTFEEVDGISWENSRQQIKFKRKSFKETLRRMGFDEATADDLLASANRDFSISSEDFAKLVAAHCEAQGPKYRLTFLVDEIGQYIGDNRRLMLNLQTVVEDLGKSCLGRVWVLVTSQEQIDSVTKIAGFDDFSKIQGRFPTRINLTSSNTDEVIRRRLLEKTAPAADELHSRFDMEEQSLQNLLAFDRNRSAFNSGYRSAEDFVHFYPFVPYQIELLQKVFEKVRTQGEAGKHLAHGERSLLNAVQEVALQLKDEGTDRLARFSQFYQTIRRFLDSSIVSTINRAREREGIEDFDIEVLKVLYMIKGVREIEATVENITTLLIDSVDAIKSDVEKQVRRSLHRLKNKVLIQEDAHQTFTFLSDDEQEIQREVERTPVNEANVDARLGKHFFNEIYSAPRFLYNKAPFDFNKKFNGYVKGSSSHDLTLWVVTRNFSEEEARLQSHNGVAIMRIPDEQAKTFEEALENTEKIDSYLRVKDASNLSEEYRKIFNHLREQREEFERQGYDKLRSACQEAVFYIDGKDYTFSGTVEHQVNEALKKLVENSYPKWSYMNESVPLDAAKETILEWANHGLPGGGIANQLAFDEMNGFLQRQHRAVLKQLFDVFTRKPYGWTQANIAGIVAALDHAGKVELTYLNEPLQADHPDYVKRLLSKADVEKIQLKVKVGMPPRVRGDIADLLQEVFNYYEPVETYQDGARLLRDRIGNVKQEAEAMEVKYRNSDPAFPYPNGEQIQAIREQLQSLLEIHDSKTFVHETIDAFDDIRDGVEQLEHYGSFYNGKGKELFDQAVGLLKSHADDLIAFDGDQEVVENRKAIEAILQNPNPYREIPNLARLCERLKERLGELVEGEAKEVLRQIEEVEGAVDGMESEYGTRPDAVSLIRETKAQFQVYKGEIHRAQNRSTLSTYREKVSKDYHHLQEKIAQVTDGGGVARVSLSQWIPATGKPLKSEEELEAFLDELRSHLQSSLKRGKNLHIIR
ncbi:hypothetical protein C8P63_13011 [Melghirimyces profundicolus]|uniref:BREX system P-loop protein BrxC n=1 Tax=Melghirimyces profundicolus TaxID=1242148 RepID=A0A2T6B9F9_9BACL|nr:BREX system P-loop protein BrxC [Melghirimyces profundicolus]PTX52699.1 hypothetical protein C8P63_13011 [Melghirimyces profundicolus]